MILATVVVVRPTVASCWPGEPSPPLPVATPPSPIAPAALPLRWPGGPPLSVTGPAGPAARLPLFALGEYKRGEERMQPVFFSFVVVSEPFFHILPIR
jgi:hypothetical protein